MADRFDRDIGPAPFAVIQDGVLRVFDLHRTCAELARQGEAIANVIDRDDFGGSKKLRSK